MKPRFTSIFAKAATLLFVMLLTTTTAWADDGATLTRFTWAYTSSTQTLTITTTGTNDGNMGDAGISAQRPWESYKNSIKHLVIGSGITYIGNYVFYNHTALQDITFEAGSKLESIGTNAFQSCTSLTSVTLPEGLTTIHNYAFNSTGLTTVTIPSSMTEIHYHVFDGCPSLTSVVMNVADPATLTLGSSAFQSGVNVYVSVYFIDAWNAKFPYAEYHCNFKEKESNIWSSGNTYVFLDNGTMTIRKKPGDGNGAMADYVYTHTPWYVFLTDIKTVIVEDGVTHIGNNTFNDSGVTSVTIPASVTSIGIYSFQNCSHLTSVTIPASKMTIDNYAFYDCASLTSVTVYATEVPRLKEHVFDDNASGRKIYVFSDLEGAYKSAENWSTYASAIEPIPDLAVNDAGGTLGKWTTYYNGLADVQVADGTTIYKATYDKSANNVTLTPVSSNIIKMGEAVLLKSENDIVLSSAVGGGLDDYDDNDLHGVDYATPLTDLGSSTDTYYVLSNKNGHFGFHKYTGTTMPANKAFLRISGDGNALAPSIDLYIDNNATGIENVQSSKLNVQCDNAWYTLDGRKLNAQPTKKGLYIVNGKKVVIK